MIERDLTRAAHTAARSEEDAAKVFSLGLGVTIAGTVLSTWIGGGLSLVRPRR